MEIRRRDVKEKRKLVEIKKGSMFFYDNSLFIRSFVGVEDLGNLNIQTGKIVCFCVECGGITSGKTVFLDEDTDVEEADGRLEWWLA